MDRGRTFSPSLSTFTEFREQAEKAVELFRNLSDEDRANAAFLWDHLGTKLRMIIQKHREAEDRFTNKIPSTLTAGDAEDLLEPAAPAPCQSPPPASLPPEVERQLGLDDDRRAIDKVLDEVIHLEEAEKEILSQLESESEQVQFTAEITDGKDIIKREAGSSAQAPLLQADIVLGSSPAELHEQRKVWNCSSCNSKFDSEGAYDIHSKQHVKAKQFRCNQCPSSFSTRGNLNVHLRSHTGDRPFECNICTRRFSSSGNLRRHLLNHKGLKPYRCSTCQSCFTEKGSLIIHQRIHSGERPYACPQCGKTFIQNSVLQSHLSVHTSEKKFSCTKCTKSFKRKAHLQRHFAYVHEGVKNQVCTECGFQFVAKSDLKRHLKSHAGERAFLCSQCGKRFMRQVTLTDHINQVHRTQGSA